MRFKPGDLVIKNTGGNKMRIIGSSEDGLVECVWATENIHEGKFSENDLISLNDYQSVIINEKRDDLINKILK
jgi:uncharacterized protein YodC (DUF2158 family)